MEFGYLLDKLSAQPFSTAPFKHLEIDDFFSPEHFQAIVESPQVAVAPFGDDVALVQGLQQAGFQPIPFPGTTEDIPTYLAWHSGKEAHPSGDTCEGFGMAFRLKTFDSPILAALHAFFGSPGFLACVAGKFDIALDDTSADSGLHKYLDGYEISPHPDVRRKALTYMININPDRQSDARGFHTHYMRFVPSKRYVQEFWKYNPDHERCWVPWDWCETVKQQTRNNSLVMFSPSDDTLHAVRAHYDHLETQRTQLYGNLWYKSATVSVRPNWRDYVISATPTQRVETRRPAKAV